MKVTNIELSDKSVIETETECDIYQRHFLILKKKKTVKKVRKFQAVSVTIAGKYWEWLELPDMIIVGDHLSFQLDAWLRNELNK